MLCDGAKGSIKSRSRNGVDLFTQQLHRRGFAEGAWLALKRYPHALGSQLAHGLSGLADSLAGHDFQL
jgi:hypothetical protein